MPDTRSKSQARPDAKEWLQRKVKELKEQHPSLSTDDRITPATVELVLYEGHQGQSNIEIPLDQLLPTFRVIVKDWHRMMDERQVAAGKYKDMEEKLNDMTQQFREQTQRFEELTAENAARNQEYRKLQVEVAKQAIDQAAHEELEQDLRDQIADLVEQNNRNAQDTLGWNNELKKKERLILALKTQLQGQPADPHQPRPSVESQTAANPPIDRRQHKLADPDKLTNGKTPSFDKWEREMRGKLLANSDWFPTEASQITYACSRIAEPASDHLDNYFGKHSTRTFRTIDDLFKLMERNYGIPNKEVLYAEKFDALQQGNMEFTEFYTEFLRLAGPLDRDERTLIQYFKKKLNRRLQTAIAPIIAQSPRMSLDTLTDLTRDIDIEMPKWEPRKPQTSAATAPAPRNSPGPRASTVGTAPPQSGQGRGRTQTYTPVRTNSTFAEREALRQTGACFQCKQPGHRAHECPQRQGTVNEISVGSAVAEMSVADGQPKN